MIQHLRKWWFQYSSLILVVTLFAFGGLAIKAQVADNEQQAPTYLYIHHVDEDEQTETTLIMLESSK